MSNWKIIIKKMLSVFFARDISELVIDEDVKVLSFDIYDTLVLRNPTMVNVFEVVQHRYNNLYGKKIDFVKQRKHAEKIARKRAGKKEISFDEIYEEMSDLSQEEKKTLKDIEMQTEYDVSTPNVELINIFNRLKTNKIRLVVTSDMYLPRELIEKILDKCGVKGYYDLFLSSDTRVRKRTGDMYKYIATRYGLPENCIFHIGDNAVSDYIIPRIIGVRGFLYKKHKY